MNHLYYQFWADSGDVVEVTLDQQANVLLLDSGDYSSYKSGRRFRYIGGLAEHSPYRIPVPSNGSWYTVVDLGGRSGTVRCGCQLIKRH